MPSENPCREIVDDLCAAQASIAPKYLYDDLGSSLFELITQLPEYYPTRVECDVMKHHASDIRAAAGTGAALIDLGAGNCRKARALFPTLRPRRYVAVDISTAFLDRALASMHSAFPEIGMFAVGADLSAPISLPALVDGMRQIFFFAGSSIGNLHPQDALALLERVHRQCAGRGGLLIGVDLMKDEAALQAAYNDALGITAAFNLNVLNHVNTLLGSDFKLSDWHHRAFYDTARARVEMHLEARHDLVVTWPGGARRFAAGESIHTENSYKYRLDDFKAIMARAGFGDIRAWTDERAWFAVCYGSA